MLQKVRREATIESVPGPSSPRTSEKADSDLTSLSSFEGSERGEGEIVAPAEPVAPTVVAVTLSTSQDKIKAVSSSKPAIMTLAETMQLGPIQDTALLEQGTLGMSLVPGSSLE